MAYPSGVYDGAFIRFDGWDVLGNDVGRYFTDLGAAARVRRLKGTALEYGASFFAFNTNGWAKYWDIIDPSKFVQAPGSSLWIRVEYPGWVFYPQKDAQGADFGNVQVRSPPAVIRKINKRDNPFEVIAFNTNGWIKRQVTYPLKNEPSLGVFQGVYVRVIS